MPYFGQKFQFTILSTSASQISTQTFHVSPTQSEFEDSLSTSLADLSLKTESMDGDLIQKHGASNLSIPKCESESFTCSTPTRTGEKSVILDLNASSTDMNMSNNSPDVKCTPVRGSIYVDRDNFRTPDVSRTKSVKNLTKFYKVTSKTVVVIDNLETEGQGQMQRSNCTVTYADIGGLSKQIAMLKEMISLPLESPELLKSYGKCWQHTSFVYQNNKN